MASSRRVKDISYAGGIHGQLYIPCVPSDACGPLFSSKDGDLLLMCSFSLVSRSMLQLGAQLLQKDSAIFIERRQLPTGCIAFQPSGVFTYSKRNSRG